MLQLMKDIWKKISVILQIVLIVGALITVYVNLSERLTRIENDITWIKQNLLNQ